MVPEGLELLARPLILHLVRLRTEIGLETIIGLEKVLSTRIAWDIRICQS
jgi:hypothetical protein